MHHIPFFLSTPFILLPAWLLLAADHCVRADPVNRTIDDQYEDPTGGGNVSYGPIPEAWIQGNGCNGCAVTPDEGYAYKRTWHDATANNQRGGRSLTITFPGSL